MVYGIKLPALAITLTMAFASGAGYARSGGTDPLEFSYRISGGQKVRPVLVFNDGGDTFIQPNPETESELTVKGGTIERQGPYFVIKGVVQEFTLISKKHGSAQVTYIPPAKPLPAHPVIAPVQAPAPKVEGAPVSPFKAEKLSKADYESALKTATQSAKEQELVVQKSDAGKQTEEKVEVKKSPAIDKETESRAKSFANELNAETLCKPKADLKESAFVVAFANKSSTLSTGTLDRLNSAIGSVSTVTAVNGFAEDSSNQDKLAAARAKTIHDAVRSLGVPASKIIIGTRKFTGIGTEIRVEHEIQRECEMPKGAIAILAHDAGRITIGVNADSKDVLAKIALQTGRSFRVEGPERPIQLNTVIRDQSLVKVLTSIGNALGNNADVILRSNEIALRYKDNGKEKM